MIAISTGVYTSSASFKWVGAQWGDEPMGPVGQEWNLPQCDFRLLVGPEHEPFMARVIHFHKRRSRIPRLERTSVSVTTRKQLLQNTAALYYLFLIHRKKRKRFTPTNVSKLKLPFHGMSPEVNVPQLFMTLSIHSATHLSRNFIENLWQHCSKDFLRTTEIKMKMFYHRLIALGSGCVWWENISLRNLKITELIKPCDDVDPG